LVRGVEGNFFPQMQSATVVFMIATYWVGGSGHLEGGKYLASGRLYNKDEFVAAHRTLPFGTILHVCLRRKCISVVVRDRGPYLAKMDLEKRIDLSYGAAKALDMLHDGRQRVRISIPMPAPKPANGNDLQVNDKAE
jgi:rare lipoprotein A